MITHQKDTLGCYPNHIDLEALILVCPPWSSLILSHYVHLEALQ